MKGIEVVREDEKHFYIKAGAGENWHSFVLHCVNNQLCRDRKFIAYSGQCRSLAYAKYWRLWCGDQGRVS